MATETRVWKRADPTECSSFRTESYALADSLLILSFLFLLNNCQLDGFRIQPRRFFNQRGPFELEE